VYYFLFLIIYYNSRNNETITKDKGEIKMKELTLIEKMILIVYFAGKRLQRLGSKIVDLLLDLIYIHDCFICKIFKSFGRKLVFGLCCVIVFFFAWGTAGGSDLNLLTFSEVVRQMVIEIVLLIYFFHNARI